MNSNGFAVDPITGALLVTSGEGTYIAGNGGFVKEVESGALLVAPSGEFGQMVEDAEAAAEIAEEQAAIATTKAGEAAASAVAAQAAVPFSYDNVQSFLESATTFPAGSVVVVKTGEVYKSVTSGGDFAHPVTGGMWTVLSGAAASAPLSMFNNFGTRADGNLVTGDRMDSGHTIAIAGQAGVSLPVVVNGEYRVSGYETVGSTTGYIHIDTVSAIAELSAEVRFYEGAAAGNVFATVVKGKNDTATSLIDLLHPIFYRDRWYMQIRMSEKGTVLYNVDGGNYIEPMVDGLTYRTYVRFYPEIYTVVIVSPDGQVHAVNILDFITNLADPAITDPEATAARLFGHRAYWQVNRSAEGRDDWGYLRIGARTEQAVGGFVADDRDMQIGLALGRRLDAALPLNDELTFTPNATGWWRIWTATGLTRFDGEVEINVVDESDNLTGIALNVGVAAFSGQANLVLNQVRYLQFNSAVSQVRVGNNASNTLYFDVYVAFANRPITIKMSGVGTPQTAGLRLSNMVPTAGPSAPTRSKTLLLGPGLRTVGDVRSQGVVVGVNPVTATTSPIDTTFEVSEVNAASGNLTLTMPSPSELGRRHTLARVDSSANTVTVVAYFTDGTTSKTLAAGASMTLVGVSNGSPTRWAVI